MNYILNFPQSIDYVDKNNFDEVALTVFQYQYEHNEIYRSFANLLNKTPETVRKLQEIPFLPIELFKNHQIKTGGWKEECIFTSSGTTGTNSRHYVKSLNEYLEISEKAFTEFYGSPSEWLFLALLPGYLERDGSSLIDMCNRLISLSKYPDSGFFLNDHHKLNEIIVTSTAPKKLLIGVTYALLDYTEGYHHKDAGLTVMETGGMKGKRKELTRFEIHEQLKGAFGVKEIHSEYGMTELFSQAYSKSQGLFYFPPWGKALVRDLNDPLSYLPDGRVGALNMIDLGNLHTCSFIATSDLGKRLNNDSFEVMGRMDNSDIRGCNLMIE